MIAYLRAKIAVVKKAIEQEIARRAAAVKTPVPPVPTVVKTPVAPAPAQATYTHPTTGQPATIGEIIAYLQSRVVRVKRSLNEAEALRAAQRNR